VLPPGNALSRESLHGLLVVDKPAGITSRSAVDRAQRWFPRGTRLGHTGTLDPLATGVLVLCLGAATRLTEYVQRMAKVYRAGIVLGARSDTDDADGQVTPLPTVRAPGPAEVADALRAFVGEIEQVPPAFSAARVAGRRAYDLARQGHAISLAPRRVAIHAIDVERYDYPLLELSVRCGKGTYIRALARDLGQRLGCGGYIASLRRTRVGCFGEAQALALDSDRASAQRSFLSLALAVADLPRLAVTTDEAACLRHGRPLPLPEALYEDRQEIAVFAAADVLVAVARVDRQAACLRPDKVFLAL
jgi:tRNA pseudouridine55 synthase